MSLRFEFAAAALFVAAAVLASGPRRLLGSASETWEAVGGRSGAAPWLLGALGLTVLLVLAQAKVDPARYAASTVASTVSFVALFALAHRFGRLGGGLLGALERVPLGALAAAVAAAAWSAQHWILEGVPHLSDEVAYQFQARALATGRLGFTPPPDPEFFEFIHTTVEGGVWHGIMNPGWPAALALGAALGVPGLVNPVLAAASLLLLYAFWTRVGLSPRAARLAALALAVSPFFLFMSATWMAHTASLFALALFLLAWVRTWERPSLTFAMLAGLALALGLLIRPLDAAVAAAPFGTALGLRALRRRAWLAPLLLMGAVGATGAVATFAYNQALTGDGLEFPQTRYFEQRFPGQGFGLGFGPQMGSRIHGPEWPGYAPSDAPRVTSHRLLHLLQDLHALPWVLAAALAAAVLRRGRTLPETLLLASALALLAVYLAHFYHGLAYGSRHYYLALPALAALLARPVADGLERGGAPRRVATAAVFALLVHALLFATPPRARLYADAYRSASGSLRDAVSEAGLDNALVFVAGERWGWKSGFPLNSHPLGGGAVVYARDLGAANGRLVAHFPGRRAWLARIRSDDSVEITPLVVTEPLPDDQAEHAERGP